MPMNTENYDLNGNGNIDPDEREIMLEDRRRAMEDADAKRDAQRRMTWFALSGMVLYPLAILGASIAGLSTAAGLIADIANISSSIKINKQPNEPSKKWYNPLGYAIC